MYIKVISTPVKTTIRIQSQCLPENQLFVERFAVKPIALLV
jgi:hypothetical protein